MRGDGEIALCIAARGRFASPPLRYSSGFSLLTRNQSCWGSPFAAKTLPTGTAYAVWMGIGAALTVVYGMVTGSEPASLARILPIAGLVGCVIGLKLVGGNEA